MFYFNLYNLNNHQAGYPYSPIPARQLAPDNVIKPGAYAASLPLPYHEYDKKNIIAAQTITAHDYEVTVSPLQEQGRVTFAAGQKITLGDGFKVTGGGYFHGYIDPSIGEMNCSDPPTVTETDCSGMLKLIGPVEPDTIIDTDSIIVMLSPDTITTTLPCPIDTLYPHAKDFDSTATSFYWDFGNGQTSSLENPSIYYSSPGNYLFTLITSGPSNTDTLSVSINVPDCNNLRTTSQHNNAVRQNSIEKYNISIIPNPSTRIFTLICQDALQTIEVRDMLGNIVFNKNINNQPVNLDVDITIHPPGIYFLKAQCAEKVYTEKVCLSRRLSASSFLL